MKKSFLFLILLSLQLGVVHAQSTPSCVECAQDAYFICPGWVEDTEVASKRKTFYTIITTRSEEEIDEYAKKETKRLNAQESDGSAWKVTEIDNRIWRVSVVLTRFKREN